MNLSCSADSSMQAGGDSPAAQSAVPAPADPALEAKIKQYAPVDISADVSALPANEQKALDDMVQAARLLNPLFLDQVWSGNDALLLRLAQDHSPAGQAKLHYFLINKGPWDRLEGRDHIFLDLGPEAGGTNHILPSFYPRDATREEVDKWINGLHGAAHDAATSFFTVIRRDPQGRLMSVPYSVEYQNTLQRVSALLRDAAEATSQPTLKRFLELRADAFGSNDYFASDMAWMEIDASIEPTIGPYETYEDEWFGYKASFEAFIALRDDQETAKLAAFGKELQGLEDALPIDPRYRNPKLGGLAPIRVVNLVFNAGDGNRGVQTTAFNLPNDDRVIREKGAKRVMLKNIQEAKFEKVLVPISKVALAPKDQGDVSFDAFFAHTVMHELMHGLGPHQVENTGQPLRLALKDTYSAIEEAKADISGLWALQRLADKGVVSADVARTMYTTFLASAFRSIRFGVTEAHGKGVAMQLNYLLDHGAVAIAADGTFAVVPGKIKDAVAGLTHDLMTLEAQGDYAGAQTLLKQMGVVRPEVQRVLDKLTGVPVDIEPRFVSAK